MATQRTTRAPKSRRRRGEPVIRRVFAATLDQLAAVGFARLSMPEVALVAGVNKTSVYRRWPTKADLVREALHASMGHSPELPDTGDLRTDMIALARAAATFVESPVGMGVLRMLFAEGANPEVGELAASMFRQQDAQSVQALFVRAIAKGELPEHTDIMLVLSTVAGAFMHRLFVEHGRVSDTFVESVIDLVLFGAIARPGSGGGGRHEGD